MTDDVTDPISPGFKDDMLALIERIRVEAPGRKACLLLIMEGDGQLAADDKDQAMVAHLGLDERQADDAIIGYGAREIQRRSSVATSIANSLPPNATRH